MEATGWVYEARFWSGLLGRNGISGLQQKLNPGWLGPGQPVIPSVCVCVCMCESMCVICVREDKNFSPSASKETKKILSNHHQRRKDSFFFFFLLCKKKSLSLPSLSSGGRESWLLREEEEPQARPSPSLCWA